MTTTMESPRIISLESPVSPRAPSHYLILARTHIKYITTQAGAFDADSKRAYISRNALPCTQTIWHSRMINSLDLKSTKQFALLAEECYIEAETKIHQLLQPLRMAPTFLGHIHKEGRAIVFLLEKVGEAALRCLHRLGISREDTNRYNSIICPNDQATLIDFNHAKFNADPETTKKYLNNLKEPL
ncbi:alpha-galactosidase A [Xylaria grammica]|nr:alpha-galactosidase A [Xylaria grammica]